MPFNNGVALQSDGKVLINRFVSRPFLLLTRLNADGSLEEGFNASGSNTLVGPVVVKADGRILFNSWSGILGLLADGSSDPTFNPTVGTLESLALQANGKIVAGGSFMGPDGWLSENLWRMDPNGYPDPSFPPPNFDGVSVHALAVQNGGSIWIGGEGRVSDQTNSFIQRLKNTEPASERLSFDGANITWLRDGGCPDVVGPTFDLSTNGIDWTPLGMGESIPGGWRLAAASLVPGNVVRARGRVTSASVFGSACWYIQTVGRVGAPEILLQPASSTNTLGTSALFGVSVSGSEPLTYQWRKDGTPIPGATSSTLVLANIQSSDVAAYSVSVTNSYGSAISSDAQLAVGLAPNILVPPFSLGNADGATVRFSVSAAGAQPLSYQWLKNGTNLAGRTEPILVLTNIQAIDVAEYRVAVTNTYGSQTSTPAQLRVGARPTIRFQPPSVGGLYVAAEKCQRIFLEASTDLSHWTAIKTNIVSYNASIGFTFLDPNSTNSPARFYRVRQE